MIVTPKLPRQLALVSAIMVGSVMLPACSSDSGYTEPDQYANCIDKNGNVVDDKYCDDPQYYGNGGGGGYFFFMSTTHYSSGQSIGSASGTRINPADSAGRVSAGLPGSGKAGGSSVRGGGIGKGGGAGSAGHGSSGGS